ncbi:Zn(II)2Cys6 transcription factor [Aspergillus mulundensis]|uniref:Putative Zn(II)2Cys6 transcription factor n=1 Tax=Aspergillus mulundensis TaxID=1810919 RepID=A0A3D8SIJ6_9EURO|nr:putative Zn(II)2Cys6 transcription factor [Aspergillus mulundensis]RDW86113.1 putative Zn(II)2Cys6 transcription factor [Aspergillus mulundensis]
MSSKRIPLSCENCRQRKIRCITSTYQAPCDTCLRRGYASSCRFRRQDSYGAQSSAPERPAMGNVSALEGLLRQNIAVTTALLGQRNETRLPSPDSSPASSLHYPVEHAVTPEPVRQSGHLVATPSNHVRFVPSNDLGDSSLIDAMHESTPDCPTGFPFFEQPGPSAVSDELLDLLPPLPQLEELKSAYFIVFSPLFHVLHDPTFHARYEDFRQNPKSVSLSFLALLFVILSLSVTALDDDNPLLMHLGRDPSPGANIRSLSAKYRAAAMRCLVADNFMFRHNLCTVQSLVLLIYAINHAQGPAWSLLGTTLHIAVAIGCAVEPSRLNVGRIEAEERRRCWAALQMLYTIQNTCLGNLMPFRIDSHVDLPADIEDEELSFEQLPNDDPSAPPTKMTYLLYKFRLYNLAFDICQLSSPADPAKMSALDARLAQEQQSHFVRFAARPFDELESYHQAHYYILANYINHLTLLLHRPSLPAASVSGPRAQSPEQCEHAATTILSNFEKLSSDQLFRSYRWYVDGLGSFYAFFSITTLLVLHGNGQLNAQSKSLIMNLVLRCVGLLVGNASRSAVCSKAAAILEPVIRHLDPVALGSSHTQNQIQTRDMSPVSEAAVLSAFPELGGLFFDVPCEQWLTPAGFPWIAS